MKHTLLYEWLGYILLFGSGCAAKPAGKEENGITNHIINRWTIMLVEQLILAITIFAA